MGKWGGGVGWNKMIHEKKEVNQSKHKNERAGAALPQQGNDNAHHTTRERNEEKNEKAEEVVS